MSKNPQLDKQKAKEKKQMLMLIGIVSIGLIYALGRFVISPLFAVGDEAQTESQDQEFQLQKAKRLLNKRADFDKEIEGLSGEIRKVTALYLPPDEDALSWVTSTLNQSAREVGLTIEWVEEVQKSVVDRTRRGANVKKGSDPVADALNSRSFRPYVVRVLTVSSYERCRQLMNELEEGNPYLCISQVEVLSQPASVESHRFTFVVEWPQWIDPEMIASLNNIQIQSDDEEANSQQAKSKEAKKNGNEG